ncbi:glycoside hydrolase family protein [Geminocystis sp. GBBB08]|uniref:lysozyme n=1 Tax=Geminocystis sp. GBBB08 TaxID=2604140 RepID=UPI0027E38477|nr:glycoside hydrolase family protein [Geminocystis sp. GBBB08]MBL1208257.1 glycoside hydrolase family protein [Geminocystis sp. GBBB08]
MTLSNIINPIHINKLSIKQVKELQRLLNNCGYKLAIDGIVGNQTLTAFNSFKKGHNLTEPNLIGKTTIEWLMKYATNSSASNSELNNPLLFAPCPLPFERKINQRGLDLIKEFEGFRNQAYICPAGIPTIGYGSTFYLDGRKVKMGDRISKEEAEKLLIRTVQTFADGVSKVIKVPLTSNQFSALVSLCFNIGVGAFQKSTLVKVLNQGNYSEAANQFLRWNRGGGKVLAGLTRRRTRERQLFLS